MGITTGRKFLVSQKCYTKFVAKFSLAFYFIEKISMRFCLLTEIRKDHFCLCRKENSSKDSDKNKNTKSVKAAKSCVNKRKIIYPALLNYLFHGIRNEIE